MPQSRQLAAIMFADIVGYTAMMQEDEAMALMLRDKLQNKLESEVVLHHGTIITFNGDGAMCSFPSTIEAIHAALSLQLHMRSEPLVPLRIGMHSGDVILEGKTMYGDGVNIASRLESFAVPGSIFISGKVYDDIKNQKEISAVSLGRFLLKNVKDQVEIFAISNEGIVIPEKAGLEGKGEKAPGKCILVLPFVNMSNEAGQEYFSDGLTEELISNLSRLKNIKVISRTTSMKFKNSSKDIKTIGMETGASFIMEGSVRKQGANLKITAQFIDAANDIHLWTEDYRGTMDDIFDIQEKVSVKITEALRLQLTSDEKNTLQKRYTDNTEAYQLYLQGRYFWKKRNEDSLKTAIRYFERAIEKDADYALAWAGLADTYSLMGEFTNISRRELVPKITSSVNKAIEIDNALPEAHISLAVSLMLNEWDWLNAEKEFKRGIQLGPNYATGHHWFSEWLFYKGRTVEAFSEISLAIELDPISPAILKDKGILYYYNEQYDEAIEMAMKTLELDAAFVPAHRLLSLAYTGKKMFEDAIAENERWGRLTGNTVKADIALAQIYAAAGRTGDAQKIIQKVTVDELTANDYRGMALIYASMQETDKAFEWLEKSYEMHEESLCSLPVDPKLQSLRSDPRFRILLKKIGL